MNLSIQKTSKFSDNFDIRESTTSFKFDFIILFGEYCFDKKLFTIKLGFETLFKEATWPNLSFINLNETENVHLYINKRALNANEQFIVYPF